jgi:ribonucleoside-diphosphate reductase alpha chain
MTVPMSALARTTFGNKYAHDVSGRKEEWAELAERQVGSVVRPYLNGVAERLRPHVEARRFVPGGRYLYAVGRRYPQVNNCFLFRAHDSREGWADLMSRVTSSLMTGGGVGVVYSDLRPEGTPIRGMGGTSTGPCALMRMVNEAGRYIMQGGSRRSALWAGLHWSHPDVFKFIALKRWSPLVHHCKGEDFNFAAQMDGTNISVILDDDFLAAVTDPRWSRTVTWGGSPHAVSHRWAQDVYWQVVDGMVRDGEPGFSVDCGENAGENLRNACTEVTSSDDGDMCNLGSVNLAAVESPEQLREVVELGTAFLLCGTIYSKLPVEAMYRVREKNRRLGLGLMGVHEWLLRRGYRYEPNDELGRWLAVYATSGHYAALYADKLGVSRPVATRSIAPTGTISIIADTTSGIEPIFAAAYKRRYLDGKDWKAQVRVDPSAARLIANGVDPDAIEDSMTLADDVGRRVAFQGWVQRYVDHGISSTINLPRWGSSTNNESTVRRFGHSLLEHLPTLRGITAYPDGARGGQPLVRMDVRDALGRDGVEFVEGGDGCPGGVCGG